MQSFIKIIALYKSYGQFLYFKIFASAKPRPNRTKNDDFDKTSGWSLTISKCMQNFIEIFKKVQEIRSVVLLSEFGHWQSLER